MSISIAFKIKQYKYKPNMYMYKCRMCGKRSRHRTQYEITETRKHAITVPGVGSYTVHHGFTNTKKCANMYILSKI